MVIQSETSSLGLQTRLEDLVMRLEKIFGRLDIVGLKLHGSTMQNPQPPVNASAHPEKGSTIVSLTTDAHDVACYVENALDAIESHI